MSLGVFRRPVCRACRNSVLQSFAAIAGLSIPPPPPSQQLQFKRPQHITRRYFQAETGLYSSRSDIPEAHQKEPESSSDAEPLNPSSSQLPWYLQVETPEAPEPIHPLAQRQIIPELPPNPPSILSPILQYLSIDSGLDNLNLMDLRHLDPPPALGANLIMIIGTARSVKHLNVSADRFCRWLRTNHKLKPYADGLLGRNELKLKLRRKARRLKLAQSVGNTLEGARDDGITTGWICVNLGSMEPEEETAKEDAGDEESETNYSQSVQDADDEGYVGFGSRYTGPRIVVQMFTEEKRVEMDLEGLWHFRLARRAGKEEQANAAARDALEIKNEDSPGEFSSVAGSGIRAGFGPTSTGRGTYGDPLVRAPVMYT